MNRTLRNAIKANPAVTSITSNEIEVFIADADCDGYADDAATYSAAREIMQSTGWGGFRNGFGGWTLRKGYTVYAYDFNSTASREHY